MRRLRVPTLASAIATLVLAVSGCGGSGGPVAQTQVDHATVNGSTGKIEFTVTQPSTNGVEVQIERHVGDTAVEHNLFTLCPGYQFKHLSRLHAFICFPIHHTSHNANFEPAQILGAGGACKTMPGDRVLVEHFGVPCNVTYAAGSDPGTDGRLELQAITIKNHLGTLGTSSHGATFREGILLN